MMEYTAHHSLPTIPSGLQAATVSIPRHSTNGGSSISAQGGLPTISAGQIASIDTRGLYTIAAGGLHSLPSMAAATGALQTSTAGNLATINALPTAALSIPTASLGGLSSLTASNLQNITQNINITSAQNTHATTGSTGSTTGLPTISTAGLHTTSHHPTFTTIPGFQPWYTNHQALFQNVQQVQQVTTPATEAPKAPTQQRHTETTTNLLDQAIAASRLNDINFQNISVQNIVQQPNNNLLGQTQTINTSALAINDNKPTNLSTNISNENKSDDKPYACNQCKFKAKESSKLKRHMLTHTGEKPFACNICEYRSKDNSKLKRHMMTHTGEKPFACPECDFRCRENSKLKIHRRHHHGANL